MLGQAVFDRFGGLPFLFKVLSAGESLSIQAHPTKRQAESLHAKDPAHYPDDNHKPEIAIALDGLTALIGFKPFADLATTLDRSPEIADFVGDEVVGRIAGAGDLSTEEQTARVRAVLAALILNAAANPEHIDTPSTRSPHGWLTERRAGRGRETFPGTPPEVRQR